MRAGEVWKAGETGTGRERGRWRASPVLHRRSGSVESERSGAESITAVYLERKEGPDNHRDVSV